MTEEHRRPAMETNQPVHLPCNEQRPGSIGEHTSRRPPGIRDRQSAIGPVVFIAIVLTATLCWIQLARWYSLFDRYDTDFFAFEKLPGGFDSPILRKTIWIFLALSLCYALGLLLLHRMPALPRIVRLGVVAAWLGPGLCNVFIFPFGALDVFRYMIALKMAFFYHENPFVQGFMHHKFDPFAKHAFLLHLPNAKGPVWLLVSAIPAYLAGFDDQQRMLIALKLFNLLLIGLIAVMLYWAAGGAKRGWIAAFLFAANPLVLMEGVGVVHNDVMTAVFLVAALIALQRRSWLALPFIVMAALVKFFAFQFLPLVLLVMIAKRWGLRRMMLSLAASVVVVIVAIAPFWDGGDMIRGIERVGARYDSFPHVSLISLERQVRMQDVDISAWAEVESRKYLFGVMFVILSIPILWSVWKGASVVRAAIALYLVFLLFVTLLYPWYLIPVVAMMGLMATRLDLAYLVVATSLGLLYYPFYVWAHFGSGLSLLHLHLFLSLFLTVPMIIYLLLWYGDFGQRSFWRRRQIPRSEQPAILQNTP